MADLTNQDMREFAQSLVIFLGRENWKWFKKISKRDKELFKQLNIQLDRPYFVKGNREMLYKFKAYYLCVSIKNRPIYIQDSIYEYATSLSGNGDVDYLTEMNQDLVFLYMHAHPTNIGQSYTWLRDTIINKVADRARKGLVTIILSETSFEGFEKSEEFTVLNLGEEVQFKSLQQAVDASISSDKSSSSKGMYDL